MSLPPYLFLDLMLLHLCLCFYPFWAFVLIFFYLNFSTTLSISPSHHRRDSNCICTNETLDKQLMRGCLHTVCTHTNASVNLQHKETFETSVDSQLKFLISSLSLPEKLLSSTRIQTTDRVALSPETAVQQEPIRGFNLCWQKPISTREPPHHFLGEAVVILSRWEKNKKKNKHNLTLTFYSHITIPHQLQRTGCEILMGFSAEL